MYVTTFYSYKGGVGRTLALLNVAFELANAGLQVLVVDFDLEAPAIHQLRWKGVVNDATNPSTDTEYSHPGIVEFVGEYLNTMRVPNVGDFITDATPGKCRGEIALMPAGVLDETYGDRLNTIDWHELYSIRDGYVMFEDLRAQWKEIGFDYVLLDSRTGYTDVGGICTRHLPDAVVTMFRPDDQSLRGIKEIVGSIREEKPTPRRDGLIELHFVMAAIPDADDEDGILDERRVKFQKQLGIPIGRLLAIRHYQSMDLLTQPIYTKTRPRTRLANSYQELTRRIRAINIGDRMGILDSLKGEGSMLLEQLDEEFFDRIRRRYNTDPEILGKLAKVQESRGSFHEAADLLERVASVGSLTAGQWLRLAQTRRWTKNPKAALTALKAFFQQPLDSSFKSERVGYRLVRKGLNLLETAQVDRAPFIIESPIIKALSINARAKVACQMDLSRDERLEGITILENVLKSEVGTQAMRAEWEWQLAFARIAAGDFSRARVHFQTVMTDAKAHTSVPTAFNLAMALWAESGSPDSDAFLQVLELFDADEDTKWIESDPNGIQALAVAMWFGHRRAEAIRYIKRAEKAIHGRRNDVSCWSYIRVPPHVFLADCQEIQMLLSGEDVRPKFMRIRP